MRKHSLDKSKLLGFAANGEPLFDIVVEKRRGSKDARLLAGARALGVSKAEGGIKLVCAAQVTGLVKDN